MTKRLSASKLLRTLIIPLSIALTACQSLQPPILPRLDTAILHSVAVDDRIDKRINSPIDTPINARIKGTPPIHFSITGKIGVRTLKQSGSAFYAWSQEGERFAIDLTGALGIGLTHIAGIPGHVSLQSAKTGYIEATTPEELLQRATGWQAPISYLPHWINGELMDATSPVTRDAQQRIVTVSEGGWDVVFDYDDLAGHPYPRRLVMHEKTPLQDQNQNTQTAIQNNRVILTIQRKTNPSTIQSSGATADAASTSSVNP